MRLLCALLALSVPVPAAAQQLALEITNPEPGPAERVGDVDGDGLDDLLVGEWSGDPLDFGFARVHSTRDGSVLLALTGQRPGDGYGSSLAGLADLDGDGVRDFAVGAPTPLPGVAASYVRVHSAASGLVLYEVQATEQTESFGSALSGLGDVDGDGLEDLAVASPLTSTAWAGGHVEVLSGATGAPLYEVGSQIGPPPPTYYQNDIGGYGTAVTSIADIDGDGARELVVGFPRLDAVEIRSGASGFLLHTLGLPATAGFGFQTFFGGSLSGGGDFDGDGREDLVVGAPWETLVYNPGSYEGPGYNGAVYVFRASDWTQLRRIPGTEASSGAWVGVSGDQDADGIPEVVWTSLILRTGCCHYFPGSTFASSGADGTTLSRQYYMPGPLRSVGDLDRDGFDDYVTGGELYSSGASHTTWLIYGGRTLPDLTACSKVSFPNWSNPSGCDPVVGTYGEPSVTSGFGVLVSGYQMPADRRTFLFWGTGAAAKPFLGGALCSNGPYKRLPLQGVVPYGYWGGNCPGYASQLLDPAYLAQNGLTPGTTFTAQFYLRPEVGSGGAAEVSAGAVVTVWP